MKKKLVLAGATCAALLVLAVLAVPQRAAAGPTTVIIIGDQPFPCKIVKHDEENLTVYLLELKTTTKIKWAALSPMERRRLKSLVQAQEFSAGLPLGDKIDGVEVTLNTGMKYQGLELTDRPSQTLRYFRFPGVPFMAISKKDVKSVRPIKIYAGKIYSPKERYKRKIAISPPKSAEDHFRLAEWCMSNELVEEATDNFAKAQLLDAGYGDRCKDKKPLLEALAKKKQARELDREFLIHKAAGRYGKALKIIDILSSRYPDFEKNTERAMEKPIIEKKRARMLRKEVVSLYYMYMDHFVQKCAYDRISETPPIPVKVIYLKNSNMTIEGRIKSGGEDGDEIMLESGGRTYAIRRDLIARMEQKLIEKGPFRYRTLAECRKYVTDTKGGISAAIIAAVSKDTGIEEKKTKEIWAGRLEDVIRVEETGLKEPELVAAYHDAHWGLGSWLRGAGAKGGPGQAGTSASGTPAVRNPGRRGVTNPRGSAPGGKKKPKWDDPETWWKKQRPNVKAQILKAMCAEKIMRVEKIYEEPCVNCAGTGHVVVIPMGVGATGGKFKYACSVCRGTGKFWGVSYR